MRITSRPDTEEEPGIALEWLSERELELIAAYLWPTRLGKHISPYRDAAFSLMEKITAARGSNFLPDAAMNVDMMIAVLDSTGSVSATIPQSDIEFIV